MGATKKPKEEPLDENQAQPGQSNGLHEVSHVCAYIALHASMEIYYDHHPHSPVHDHDRLVPGWSDQRDVLAVNGVS